MIHPEPDGTRPSTRTTTRRDLLKAAGAIAAAPALGACSAKHDETRYTRADRVFLAAQRKAEAAAAGEGRFGELTFRGYRGLSQLPWFELDPEQRLRCIDDSVPYAVDVHAHLGMSILFKPELDLNKATPRVMHILDCDRQEPGCDLNLDVYINGNFTEQGLKDIKSMYVTQGLWGNAKSRSHSIPNLIREMDDMRVEHSFLLPIKLGLPFGDTLTEDWRSAVANSGQQSRLSLGMSVHPEDPQALAQLRTHAAAGARLLKLHPTVQEFYPDAPELMPLYEEAQRLGLVLFFHGGRADIEPEPRQPFAIPRHYEAVLAEFPRLPVVFGHAGARDGVAMLAMARRHKNAWLGIHGQSVSRLDQIIEVTRGERLLFGTDWPWYHLGATLAKVLICTDQRDRQAMRQAILRDNALALFPDIALT